MKTNDKMIIGCVILAAGNSARFGENKLLAEINGKTMIELAFEAVPEDIDHVAVVTQYDSIKRLAEDRGFDCIINSQPEQGLSLSVKLGTMALKDKCGAIMYQVSDQPWLKRESTAKMLDVFRDNPDSIVGMSSGMNRGNPCVFSKAYFDELCSLSGDRGGRSVIEKHKDDLILVEVPAEELADVDTPGDILTVNHG